MKIIHTLSVGVGRDSTPLSMATIALGCTFSTVSNSFLGVVQAFTDGKGAGIGGKANIYEIYYNLIHMD